MAGVQLEAEVKSMLYTIACVVKIKENHFTQMIDGFRMDIDKSDRLQICEVADERIPQKAGEKVNSMIIHAEAEKLKSVIDRSDYIIVLCIEGRKTTTSELAAQIKKAADRGCGTVTFVIGGSLGLAPEIIRMADYKMSISNMTFPHQLMRVALAEQLAKVSRMWRQI